LNDSITMKDVRAMIATLKRHAIQPEPIVPGDEAVFLLPLPDFRLQEAFELGLRPLTVLEGERAPFLFRCVQLPG
jgi:hypothetical protein